tara:strand:+ start:452 stop:682 length:231 start_codon:yes stop_codon:yes gene_type:complete
MQNIIQYISNLFSTAIKIYKRNKFTTGQIVDLSLYGHNTQIEIVASDYKSRCYKVKWFDDGRVSFQTKDFINKFSV